MAIQAGKGLQGKDEGKKLTIGGTADCRERAIDEVDDRPKPTTHQSGQSTKENDRLSGRPTKADQLPKRTSCRSGRAIEADELSKDYLIRATEDVVKQPKKWARGQVGMGMSRQSL